MDAEPVQNDRTRRDREAVEQILGGQLSQDWPGDALPPGTRVRVVKDLEWDGPWREEFLATIDSVGAPEPITHPSARSGELKYWVAFDEPQLDAAGDGPYRAAQIWGRYLRAAQPEQG